MKIKLEDLDGIDVTHHVTVPTEELHGLIDHITESALTLFGVYVLGSIIKSALSRD